MSCPLTYNWLKDTIKRYIYITLAINILVGDFATVSSKEYENNL